MNMSKVADIMIGNTSRRQVAGGGAWFGKGQVLASYEDAIPVQAVYDKLLNWAPLEVPNANLIPLDDPSHADGFLGDGTPYRLMVRDDHKAIVRSDTFESMGVFTNTYDSSAYNRMVGFIQDVFQGALPVWNAGLLGRGKKFFITVGMDQTMHDDKSGLDFWPYLMFHSSLDGSLANTFVPGTGVAQCDNMFRSMRKSAAGAGRLVKFKRSRHSLSDVRIRSIRDALGIMTLEAEQFSDDLHNLVDTPLTRADFHKALGMIIPEPKDDASKAAQTRWENQRDGLVDLYLGSPMVAPWKDTAFGFVQMINTYNNRYKSVRGALQVERTFERALSGSLAEADGAAIRALEAVLDRPLLAV
jgi:phage/plasmid-like protein (TIGR03299 family)